MCAYVLGCVNCARFLETAGTILCPWASPGKNTGVDCHALLQGIFPTQRSNLHLLHCRWMPSHRGSHNLNTYLFSIMDKTTMQNINKKIENLNNTKNQLEVETHRTHHPANSRTCLLFKRNRSIPGLLLC